MDGAERRDRRRPNPLPLQRGDELVHAFAGNVAVDERLREALGQDRGILQTREPERHGQRSGCGIRADLHPRHDAADLVARAFDEDAAGSQPPAHPLPGRGDVGLVVLPQHVHGPDDGRTPTVRHRHLESADREVDARNPRRLGARPRDTLGIDLESPHLGIRAHTREPRVQLERGDRAGAEPEVDDEGVVGAAKHGMPRDPAVDPPQPIDPGRAACRAADGGGTHSDMMPGARSETTARRR